MSNIQSKRIKNACTNCRRRKIKCPGGYPCANCLQANVNCLYEVKPKKEVKEKKGITKRMTATKSLEILDSRMLSLEKAITSIVGHLLNPNSKSSPPTGLNQPLKIQNPNSQNSEFENSSTNEEESDTSEEFETDDAQEYESHVPKQQDFVSPVQPNRLPKPSVFKVATSPEDHLNKMKKSKLSTHENKTEHNLLHNRQLETYFGTHSFLCIFSEKSLAWMQETLGPKKSNFVTPITRLPIFLKTRMKDVILKWVDPTIYDRKSRRQLLEKPFSQDSEFIFALIDTYYQEIIHCCLVINYERMKGLFGSYYGINGYRKRRFKCSEFLLMTIAIAFCLQTIHDERLNQSHSSNPRHYIPGPLPESIRSLSTEDLLKMRNEMVDYAIFYYHRISVLSDGLETIEAILLLITFVEANWFFSPVNFILISVAVRFAQEIGLHRAESYISFPPSEAERRRKIWWFCHYFDMEICFRAGKPPLINYADVSADLAPNAEDSPYNTFSPNVDIHMPSMGSKLSSSIRQPFFRDDDGNVLYHQYYFTLLTRLRTRSYESLFLASAQIDTFEKLLRTLDKLNKEMFELRECMPIENQLLFYNHPSFKAYKAESIKEESVVIVHMTFFLHLMVINRIPSVVGVSDLDKEKWLSYKNLSLDSARTILVLSKSARSFTTLTLNTWVLFFPVSAFLNLAASVINHPVSPEALSDLNLLIENSIDFFSFKNYDANYDGDISAQKFLSIMIRLVLRIVVVIYETKNNTSILENNQALSDHLNDPIESYPELLKSNNRSAPLSVLGESAFASHADYKSNEVNNLPGSTSSGGAPIYNPLADNAGFGYLPKLTNSPNALGSQMSNHLGSYPMGLSPNHYQGKGDFPVNSMGNPGKFVNNTNSTSGQNELSKGFDAGGINDLDDLFSSEENVLSDKFFSQMSNLPNFFFDNSLGLNSSNLE